MSTNGDLSVCGPIIYTFGYQGTPIDTAIDAGIFTYTQGSTITLSI
jgi:hypothetical protein